MDPTFDPIAPLPGPPDPWASTDMPSHRDGPPFHMTEMIESEPAIAARILEREAAGDAGAGSIAAAVRAAVDGGTPVVIVGCGTSEHGALGAAEILREAVGHGARHLVRSEEALELSLDPPAAGLVVGISHEGATEATNAALTAARAAGARTALLTVTGRSPGGALADLVLETQELDQSWCHTVGYISPLVAATAIAGHLTGGPVGPGDATDLLSGGLTSEATAAAERIADALGRAERILVVASGADRPAGRELVLKIEEGTWIPAAYRDLETFLHGHLAATDDRTALVAIATDRRAATERGRRLTGVLAAARVVGMPTALIATESAARSIGDERTSGGRIVIPDAPDRLPAAVAALLGSATPLQVLTERLARARGVNPDPIHRDVETYRAAAAAAH